MFYITTVRTQNNFENPTDSSDNAKTDFPCSFRNAFTTEALQSDILYSWKTNKGCIRAVHPNVRRVQARRKAPGENGPPTSTAFVPSLRLQAGSRKSRSLKVVFRLAWKICCNKLVRSCAEHRLDLTPKPMLNAVIS